jgi:DNA-binding FadR family transcriptional regulator
MYDTMFHLEIARATGNLLIGRMLGSTIDAFAQAVACNFTNDTAVRERAIHFHEEILRAINAGDEERAHAVMQQHLQDVVQVAETLKKD